MRIVLATAECARALGMTDLSVAAIVARSGVSRRSFYDVFKNRDECLLAAFDEGVRRGAALAVPAFEAESSWRFAIRAGIAALLCFIDAQPTLSVFCVVDALGAGDAVLQRRANLIEYLVAAVDGGRAHARSTGGLSALTAEAIVGALLSILHARLREQEGQPTSELLGHLTSIAVRPYLGPAVADQELRRPLEHRRQRRPARATTDSRDALLGVRIRWTSRTIAVIQAVAELGAQGLRPSNRQLGEAGGITDPGQASKLLHRLERHGLLVNCGGPAADGQPNAWSLTAKGAEIAALLGERRG